MPCFALIQFRQHLIGIIGILQEWVNVQNRVLRLGLATLHFFLI